MEIAHSQEGVAGHAYRAGFKFNPSLGYTGKPCLIYKIKNIFQALPKKY